MTPQEINEKIAKLKGWKQSEDRTYYYIDCSDEVIELHSDSPGWAGDLNAAMGLLDETGLSWTLDGNPQDDIEDPYEAIIWGDPKISERSKNPELAICQAYIKYREGQG